ncbi:hypothetical protein ZIOFF_041640 [Zingiber officinale]|uniref:Universal stress protein n=1 Tax=Zingiber officinale TaxID=94328 RepID=A0A8J5GDZ3_ZINOF|nr:hypothetical protein ZIOFF_041640 [Zingiber officinale]
MVLEPKLQKQPPRNPISLKKEAPTCLTDAGAFLRLHIIGPTLHLRPYGFFTDHLDDTACPEVITDSLVLKDVLFGVTPFTHTLIINVSLSSHVLSFAFSIGGRFWCSISLKESPYIIGIEEMEASNQMQHKTTVAVAISRTRNSNYALQWALKNFMSEDGIMFKLLHVVPAIKMVPTPMGNRLPIEQVRDDVVAAYRKEEEWRAQDMLRPYKKMCTERKAAAGNRNSATETEATTENRRLLKILDEMLIFQQSFGVIRSDQIKASDQTCCNSEEIYHKRERRSPLQLKTIIEAEVVVLEGDDAVEAIARDITESSINRLVIGASTRNPLMRYIVVSVSSESRVVKD